MLALFLLEPSLHEQWWPVGVTRYLCARSEPLKELVDREPPIYLWAPMAEEEAKVASSACWELPYRSMAGRLEG